MKASQHGPTLPYLPGLDGLRALSVLLVVLYHAELPWLPGGFLALEVFFVVSGYLITSLLCAENDAGGQINLRAFWMRRARRLLPALFAVSAAVIAYTAWLLPDELWSLRQDVVAGLTYSTNWHLILTKKSYFEQLGRPSLLRHLWSLAVEEQFYIAWPLLFTAVLARLPKKAASTSLAVIALSSASLMAFLFVPGEDPSRVYYGSDTRAQALLCGAALAFVLPPRELVTGLWARWARVADILGLGGLTVLLVAASVINDGDSFPYLFGFALMDLCALAMIVGAVLPEARLCRALFGAQVMRSIGKRSYGLYLWHWPVLALTRPGVDVTFDGPLLLTMRLCISLLLAELCFRGLEEPIRRGALRRFVAGLGAAASPQTRTRSRVCCMALGLLSTALGTALLQAVPPPDLALAWGLEGESSPGQVGTQAQQRAQAAPGPDSTVTSPTAMEAGITARARPRADGQREPGQRAAVLCLGDSVMLGASRALRAALGDVEIDALVGRRGDEAVKALRQRRAAGLLADTVVIHIGNNGWLTEADVAGMIEQLADVPRVFFVTNHVLRRWRDRNNGIILRGVQPHDRIKILDWSAQSENQRTWFRRDGCHLNHAGAEAYAALVRSVAFTQPQ